jgi:hypothetical protein
MKFNPRLTYGEYSALSPDDKKEWDKQWFAACTGIIEVADVLPTGAIVNGTYEMADPKDMIGE